MFIDNEQSNIMNIWYLSNYIHCIIDLAGNILKADYREYNFLHIIEVSFKLAISIRNSQLYVKPRFSIFFAGDKSPQALLIFIQMSVPNIKLLQSKGQLMHDDIIKSDMDSVFGNLTVKYFVILTRIAKVNLEIEKLYKDFKSINFYNKNPIVIPKVDDCYDYHKVEQIIYDLRVSTDQLICLSYVLNYKYINGKYPDKIKVDCIGKYLKSQTKYLEEFAPFKNFLKKLNEVSNAYKHSFLNGQTMNLRGSFEPVVFALDLKYNDTSGKPVFYILKLSGIIIEFDKMFQELKSTMKKNAFKSNGI